MHPIGDSSIGNGDRVEVERPHIVTVRVGKNLGRDQELRRVY